MDEKPAEAVRAKPDSSLVAACRAVGDGEADAVVSAGNTGAMLAAGLLEHPPPARASTRPGDRGRDPGARRPLGAARLRRERGRAAGAPAPVRAHGRDLRRGDARGPQARGPAALDRRGAREGQPAHARGARAARRRATSTSAATSRAATCCAGAGDVVVCDGFTGNVASSCSRARSRPCSRGSATRSLVGRAGKLGGLLIRPAARRLRERLDPDTYGGAYLLGLRGLAVIAHGTRRRSAIANAIRLAARGVEHGCRRPACASACRDAVLASAAL